MTRGNVVARFPSSPRSVRAARRSVHSPAKHVFARRYGASRRSVGIQEQTEVGSCSVVGGLRSSPCSSSSPRWRPLQEVRRARKYLRCRRSCSAASTVRGTTCSIRPGAKREPTTCRVAPTHYAERDHLDRRHRERALHQQPHLQRPRPEPLLREQHLAVGMGVGPVPRPRHGPARRDAGRGRIRSRSNANDPLESFTNDTGSIDVQRARRPRPAPASRRRASRCNTTQQLHRRARTCTASTRALGCEPG